MSALAPKADMCSATRDVRYGPEAHIMPLKFNGRFTPQSGHTSAKKRLVCSTRKKYFDQCLGIVDSRQDNAKHRTVRYGR
jgi:hypothetical protein